jgi:hypothetical protein
MLMENEIKLALKQAILKTLPIFHKLSAQYQESNLIWSKRGDGGWQGIYEQETSVRGVFMAAENQLQETARDFANLFFSTYPNYGEGKLVGCFIGSGQLAHDKASILKKALGCLWDRHQTFDCSEICVDAVVNEFAEFVDSPTLRLRFQSQLQNYQMTASSLQLAENLVIRRLDAREISDFYNRFGLNRRHDFIGIREFIIEGELNAVKTFSGIPVVTDSPFDFVRAQLDTALRCLRTFKEGYVGTDWFHFKFVKFCPLDVGSYGSWDRFVPPGIYQISNDEIEALSDHAKNIFSLSESAMETACARLTDAEARLRPQDQILDAVIGMEALLLAGLRNEDRRSELRYRFSLNYSSLFESPEERWRAYKLAKDFYDLRSRIAHGGDLAKKDNHVGEEKLDPHETAKRAKNCLRVLIKRFLPQNQTAPYKNPIFWERAYFKIPETAV